MERRHFMTPKRRNATITNDQNGLVNNGVMFLFDASERNATVSNDLAERRHSHDTSSAGNATITKARGTTTFHDACWECTITNTGGNADPDELRRLTESTRQPTAGNATMSATGERAGQGREEQCF
jgi:hypothetical protein